MNLSTDKIYQALVNAGYDTNEACAIACCVLYVKDGLNKDDKGFTDKFGTIHTDVVNKIIS